MRQYNQRRGGSAAQGYGSKWQEARAAYLLKHPLCVSCRGTGRHAAASVVDHIKPHRKNQVLFWDQSNWQALCKACHDRKSVGDGRWQ
jgi:5-methylcytosine-specific restriction protein A